MARLYAVPLSGTVTAAGGNTDLWSIAPAANKPVELRGFTLSQISEVGDAAEEGLRITVQRMPATWTAGTGGAVVTAAAPQSSSLDTVWGFVARANDTGVGTTSGTAQVLDDLGWNERNSPYEHWYPQDEYCPACFNAQALVIRLETTLADDFTFSGVAWVLERG